MRWMHRHRGRTPQHAVRELACRAADGLEVLLLWDPDHNAVSLSLADQGTGHRVVQPVPRDRALQIFNDPFGHVA